MVTSSQCLHISYHHVVYLNKINRILSIFFGQFFFNKAGGGGGNLGNENSENKNYLMFFKLPVWGSLQALSCAWGRASLVPQAGQHRQQGPSCGQSPCTRTHTHARTRTHMHTHSHSPAGPQGSRVCSQSSLQG